MVEQVGAIPTSRARSNPYTNCGSGHEFGRDTGRGAGRGALRIGVCDLRVGGHTCGMATLFRFPLLHVLRLAEHASRSKQHLVLDDTPLPRPALLLVKDRGVYLMSNGKPPLLAPGERRSLVLYAQGHGPGSEGPGGGGFVEEIRVNDDLMATLRSELGFGAEWFGVMVRPSTYQIGIC